MCYNTPIKVQKWGAQMDGNPEIRILLVDDEAEMRASIRELLSSYRRFCVAGEAESREAALALLDQREVDVIFSDIQMAGGSGFALAETVHRIRPDILVVFLTGYADLALDGYRYGPVAFLVKPVSRQRLERTLERIEEWRDRRAPPPEAVRVGIQTEGGYRIADPRRIAYLEKSQRRIKICWKGGSFDFTGRPMQELEEMLLDHDFFRCHQSYLVPLGDIQSIQKESFGRSYKLLLSGGTELPLSRKKYYELRDVLREKGYRIR